MSNCDCQKSDCNCGSNSGFIFGLICGAIIGAVIAVIIYKNNKTEVFEKLQNKIKSFFEDLIPKSETSNIQKHSQKKIIANIESHQQKTNTTLSAERYPNPISAVPRKHKSVPKTFIKPKK